MHEAFRDDQGNTQIVGIWDQRDGTGPPPPGLNYGTYYSQQKIQACVIAGTPPKSLGRNVDGHGTHVASIAAGRKVGAFFGGVAPEAKLLIVIAKADGEIGYSMSHFEALAFINQVATDLKLPVVVNLSKGMNAGAHDGKSLLEVAFDEFSSGGRKRGRVVVKSAGNERAKRGHAEVWVQPGGGQRLRWTRKPQPTWRFERIELWWNASNVLKFRLGSPAGAWSDWVSDAMPDLSGKLPAGGAFHMQLAKRHVDNGDSQLRIEIGDALDGVAEGTWTLDIVADAVPAGGAVHAWIGRGGGVPSEFQNFDNEKMTLTVQGLRRA